MAQSTTWEECVFLPIPIARILQIIFIYNLLGFGPVIDRVPLPTKFSQPEADWPRSRVPVLAFGLETSPNRWFPPGWDGL